MLTTFLNRKGRSALTIKTLTLSLKQIIKCLFIYFKKNIILTHSIIRIWEIDNTASKFKNEFPCNSILLPGLLIVTRCSKFKMQCAICSAIGTVAQNIGNPK